MNKITDKQKAMLSFMCEHFTESHRVPTYSQIAHRFGIDRGGITAYMRALAKKGYVEIIEKSHVKILKDPEGRTPAVVWKPKDKTAEDLKEWLATAPEKPDKEMLKYIDQVFEHVP